MVRLVTILINCLGIMILASPLVVWFLVRQPVPVQPMAANGFYMQDFNYSHWGTDKGRTYKDYTMTGKIMRLKDKEMGPFALAFWKELVMDKPSVAFYKEDQNYAQLTAGQGLPQADIMAGHTDFITSNMTFTQQPVLVNSQGRIFMCDAMLWDKSANTLRGEGNCQLQLDGKIVQAPVMIVDPNLNAWHVPGMVS